MRHRVDERKLGVKSAHRNAMLANMLSSLIKYGRIKTTLTRAKELRRIADKVITLGKKGTLHARRNALKMVRNSDAVKKLFVEVAPTFSDRHGGYTRIYRLGFRNGDSAPMALIEYISDEKAVGRLSSVEEKHEHKAKEKKVSKKEPKAAKQAKPKESSKEEDVSPAKEPKKPRAKKAKEEK